jgi:hypothetical protein
MRQRGNNRDRRLRRIEARAKRFFRGDVGLTFRDGQRLLEDDNPIKLLDMGCDLFTILDGEFREVGDDFGVGNDGGQIGHELFPVT